MNIISMVLIGLSIGLGIGYYIFKNNPDFFFKAYMNEQKEFKDHDLFKLLEKKQNSGG